METFARRGVGYSSDGGTSYSRGDGMEAFDVYPECIKALKIQKSASSDAKAGDEILYTFKVQNHTDAIMPAVEVRDTLQSGVSYVSSSSVVR